MTRKLNNIRRTATFAWNPGHEVPMVATGSLAGTMDDSFSNASELEIFKLDLNPESKSLDTAHRISTNSRFNTMVWGHATAEKPHGIIAGGMENGELELYDASAILDGKSSEDIRVLKKSTHSGALKSLDFNVFQTNLLASAGSNSEVFIWDLNNPATPYTPGARSAKMDDISSVAWNGQVQHILSTASTNGYTVVWDLRNKKEVMTLAYAGQNTLTGGRGSVSAIAWHPDIATQLITASDDDQHPIISLWDLRHAHSPEKTLAGHSKGVLDVSWCRQDADLLISSGRDCKTLCWNPNKGELNGELATHTKWTFAAKWCPRNPDLLATASFDGSIDISSIQGCQGNESVSDDPFETAQRFDLKRPPKWLCRPVGASFGFSGKLVTFNNKSGQSIAAAAAAAAVSAVPGKNAAPPHRISRSVKISVIETDPEIVKRSEQLESATESLGTIEALIEERVQTGKDQADWQVLKTLFSDNAREELIKYLGFEREQVVAAANELLEKKRTLSSYQDALNNMQPESAASDTEEGMTDMTMGEVSPGDTASTLFAQSDTDGIEDPFFSQAMVAGQTSAANAHSAEAISMPLVEAIVSRPFDLYPKTNNETDRIITLATMLGDFESAVNACLASERYSDALLFAICGGSDLLARTQKIYFENQAKNFAYLRLLEGIMEEDLASIVRDVDVSEWPSILVVLCTFAESKDFGPLCEVVGDRLSQQQGHDELQKNANLFYLAAGNLEKVCKVWIQDFEGQDGADKDSCTYGARLQELIEKVTIFRKAIDYNDTDLADGASTEANSYALVDLYSKYYEYAEFMAAQGKLDVALKYISLTPANFAAGKSSIIRGSVVRDRVYRANASQAGQYVEPSFPFEIKLLSGEQETQQQQPVARPNPYDLQPQQANAYQNYQPKKPTSPAKYYAPTAQYGPYGQQPQYPSPVPVINSTTTPSPPPHKDAGAWNDPPMLASPKNKTPPAVGPKKVTTPFANAPPASTYATASVQQHITPPPKNATPPPPMRGLGGPPPPPPSSNTSAGFYSARQQFQVPPLQYQHHQAPQQTATPPPPMNAAAPSPMLRGPSQQQQQRS
ncbi:hypothetical protein [Parasitella parasitica]|uniref:Protein transport protein SEC31 n=1 Tax=Parasitella parasitica TaxID=35722 RepID=A0A0B7N046_9FUNG|nr:hypothetical protein [Parasitella parasitica]